MNQSYRMLTSAVGGIMLWTCGGCGAVVSDMPAHDRHHTRIVELADDPTSPHRPAGDPVCDAVTTGTCPDHDWADHRCILVAGHQRDPKSVDVHGCPCGATWTELPSHA